MRHWSKRRVEIEAAVEKKLLAMGISPSEARNLKKMHDTATLETRNSKLSLTREELVAIWHEEGKALGFTQETVAEILQATAPHVDLTHDQVMNHARAAVRKITQNNAVFREPAIYVAVASQLIGLASADQAEAAVQELIQKELVRTETKQGEMMFTTSEVILMEREICVMAAKQNFAHVLTDIELPESLTDQQREAALKACTDPNMLTIIEGAAGSGKTFTTASIARVYEANHYEVTGLSGSWKAALNLKDEARLQDARAITGWILAVERGEIELSEKSLIVVDEAGMVSAWDMHKVIKLCDQNGAKLLLLGDQLQQKGAGCGDPLRVLSAKIGTIKIKEIVRQRNHDDRRSAEAFFDGRVKEGMANYLNKNSVHICDGGGEIVRQRMVDDWQKLREAHPDVIAREQADFDRREVLGELQPREKRPTLDAKHLLLATLNEDVLDLNIKAHDARMAAGELGESIHIHTLDCAEDQLLEFAINDQIALRVNSIGDKVSFLTDPKTQSADEAKEGVIERIHGNDIHIRTGNGITVVDDSKTKVWNRMEATIERIDGLNLYVRMKETQDLIEIDTTAEKWQHQDGGVALSHAYAYSAYSAQGLSERSAQEYICGKESRAANGVMASRHTHEFNQYINKEAFWQADVEKLASDEWYPSRDYSDEKCLDAVYKSLSTEAKKASTLDYHDWKIASGVKLDIKAELEIRKTERAAEEAVARLERPAVEAKLRGLPKAHIEMGPQKDDAYVLNIPPASKQLIEHHSRRLYDECIDQRVRDESIKQGFISFESKTGDVLFHGRRQDGQTVQILSDEEQHEVTQGFRDRYPPVFRGEGNEVHVFETGREVLHFLSEKSRKDSEAKLPTCIVSNARNSALSLPHVRDLIKDDHVTSLVRHDMRKVVQNEIKIAQIQERKDAEIKEAKEALKQQALETDVARPAFDSAKFRTGQPSPFIPSGPPKDQPNPDSGLPKPDKDEQQQRKPRFLTQFPPRMEQKPAQIVVAQEASSEQVVSDERQMAQAQSVPESQLIIIDRSDDVVKSNQEQAQREAAIRQQQALAAQEAARRAAEEARRQALTR